LFFFSFLYLLLYSVLRRISTKRFKIVGKKKKMFCLGLAEKSEGAANNKKINRTIEVDLACSR